MRKTLLTTVCALAFDALQVNAQLIAHYTFNNLSGADASGNNLSAVIVAASSTSTLDPYTDHNATANEAVAWNTGANGAGYKVQHNALLNFTNQMSIALWMKPGNLTNSHKIVDKLNGFNTGNFELDIYQGSLRFWVASGHVEVPLNPNYVNTWMHVVATYDGANAKLYINNTLVATATVTGNLTTNTSDMYIGLGQDWMTNFYGAMDDLQIYGNSLSAADVNTLYGGWSGPTSCIISKWTFNNGSINDEIGFDHGDMGGTTAPALTNDRFGNMSSAYSFDGIDDFIDFDGSHIDVADFSISFWVKTGTHNYKTIVQKWATSNGGFAIEDYPNVRSTLYTNNTSIARSILISPFSTDYWHHIVFTNQFNGSASLYIDGNLIGTDATSFSGQTITGGARLFLGATGANTNNFAGNIDDVSIYNCVLTNSEITALYTENGWGATSVSELGTKNNEIRIFPNPTNNILNITLLKSTQINIINVLGEIVYTQTAEAGTTSINVSNLSKGVYFVQTANATSIKFVKE